MDCTITDKVELNLSNGEHAILIHGLGTLVTNVEGVHNGEIHTTIPAADYIAKLHSKIELLESALKQIKIILSQPID